MEHPSRGFRVILDAAPHVVTTGEAHILVRLHGLRYVLRCHGEHFAACEEGTHAAALPSLRCARALL